MRRKMPDVDRILFVSGGELAALRRHRGLSQADLAELTGLHKNTIANIEKGTADASVLAMSLMQIHLRASGVFVERDCFVPCPDEGPEYPYPNLVVPPAIMARVMGSSIRLRRLERKTSLASLAEATGLHCNTIWNFEHGLVASSVSTTYLLFRALGVTWVGGSSEGIVFRGN